jgi:hypothetical protein
MNFDKKFLWLVLPAFVLSACNLPSVAVVPQGGEEFASILQTITAQAFNNAGSSTRVSASQLDLSSYP